MPFRKEPPHTHGTIAKSAVVLVNLGTPDAPTRAAVRRYLKQFLSDDYLWVLSYHTVFQRYHRFNHPTSDRMGREKFRGHPAFELTAYFCEKYDQNAMEPDYATLPLEAFEPMVYRFFNKTPRFVGRR